jgi:hypothetical protein
MDAALIHRARLLTYPKSGARDAQGEYGRPAEPEAGPWIDARIMRSRGSSSKRRRAPDATEAVVNLPFEVLVAPTVLVPDGAGGVVEEAVELTGSAILETDCPVLGDPTLELSGTPELLNDGEDRIGWFGQATIAKDVA